MPEAENTPLYREFAHPRHWGMWLGLGVLYVIAQLPLSWQRGLGRGLGRLAYRLLSKRRHIAEVNLRLCFPELSDEQRRDLAIRTFENNAIGYFEAATAWFNSPQRFRRRFEPITRVVGMEHLKKAQAAGNGVLLLGGHYSTLDLGGALYCLYAEAGAMQRDHDDPLFNEVMSRSRRRIMGPLIHKDDLRGLMRLLKRGGTIWYATDQDYGRKGSVFAPFFNVPAATLTTTARIAARTGAAVVPFSHFRTEDGHYEVYFDAPLQNFPSGDDLADATQANLAIENAVRRNPSQYLWMHRRFKSEPDGDDHRKYR